VEVVWDTNFLYEKKMKNSGTPEQDIIPIS